MKALSAPAQGLPRTLTGQAMNEYMRLVRALPLVHIEDDTHLASALAMIDRLLDKPIRSQAEEAYLGALTDLVEIYEDAAVAIPARTGVDALSFLMEANGLKQADLIPVLGRRSIVSEILRRKRGLALSHIQKLAAYFHVSPATFIDDAHQPGSLEEARAEPPPVA